MMPTNVAARMTLAADPDSLQGAVAAGILGAGPVILGTAGECARLLEEAQTCRTGAPADDRRGRLSDAGGARPGLRPSRPPAASTRAPSGSSSSPTRAA